MKTQIALPTTIVLLAYFSACPAQDHSGAEASGQVTASSRGTWSGWYLGAGIGVNRTSSSVAYQHLHAGNCVNLNYGSEWPGDACEGNQDYASNFDSTRSGLSLSLKVGHNWQLSQYLLGIVTDIAITKSHIQNEMQIISNTWGDNLSISVDQGNYFSVRTLAGKPYGNYLPYVTAGVSAVEIKTSITQEQPGYPSRAFEKSPYQFGYVIGGGLKRLVNNRLIIGAEYLHSDFAASSLDQANVILDGGIRYPDTSAKTEITSDIVSLIVEYKF